MTSSEGNDAAPTATSAEVAIPRRAWHALAVSCAGFSLISFNTTATNLAFGDIAKDFPDATQATVSWVASIFFIGMASLLLVSGRLADRVGRRRIYRVGLATFGLSALLSALAPSIWVLIFARFVAAAAGALVIPSSLAVALPEFPRQRHFTAIAMWSATGPLASAIAPGLSAVVLSVANWRVLFALSLPIAAVALGASWLVLSESKAERRSGSLDWLGVVAGTGAIGGLVFAVSQGTNLGWLSAPILSGLGAAVVLGPFFIQRCRTHPEPLLNLKAFLLPPVLVANIASFFLNIAGLAVWLIWPLFYKNVWHYSNLKTALGLMPGPVVSGFFITYGGRLSERIGHEVLVRWASLLPILSMLTPLLFLRQTPSYWMSGGPSIGLFGAGWSLTQPSLNSGVMSRVSADLFGEVNAAFNTVRNIAGALGIAVAVAIVGDIKRVDIMAAYHRVFWVFLVSVSLCWAVLFFVYPQVSRKASAQLSTSG